jgi:small-conductance mechanosensitive channel
VTAGLGARRSALLALLLASGARAQAAPQDSARSSPKRQTTELVGYPVVLDGDSLFSLYDNSAAYTAKERAARVSDALSRIANAGLRPTDSVGIMETGGRSAITIGGQPLFVVTDTDAAAVEMTRPAAARRYADRIRSALPVAERAHSAGALWRDAGIALAQTIVAIILLLLANFAFPRLYKWLDSRRAKMTERIGGAGIKGLTGDRVVDIALGLARLARVAFALLLFAAYLPAVLSVFPQTAGVGRKLVVAVVTPLGEAAQSVLEYLPKLVLIAIIAFGTRLVLRGVRSFFTACERGTVQIKNFDREWAIPTYELLRPLLIALAFALAFPYLPGADSDAIKGVSIFLGVLLSFGSSSAVANVMAGVVLLYSRAFHVGDWVRIGDQEGAVISRGLLVTRIRTAKHVDISVPSAVVLNGHIHNYTAQGAEGRLILHSTVTIGYDAPWRTVHELLIAAAKATVYILPSPAPFVLQTALGDFSVSYQINAFTNRAEFQPVIYSDLHRNIQEQFNAAGVEIMSPNFLALRDGNTVTIPEKQHPPGYVAPSFRVTRDPE